MTARLFLDTLFGDRDKGLVELRAIPSARRTWTRPGVWGPLGPFITAEVRHRQDVYVGVATRRDASSGTTENLAQTSVVWVDHECRPQKPSRILQGFPFPPALVVLSGLGTHRYWKLREPLDLRQAAGLGRLASRSSAAWPRISTATIAPRIRPAFCAFQIRLTTRYGAPRPVTVLHTAPTTLNLCELEEFLPAEVVRRDKQSGPQMGPAATIRQGTRNDTFHSLIRSLRCKGLPFNLIDRTVRLLNEECCDVPLRDEEIRTLLRTAGIAPDRAGFTVPDPQPRILHDAELRPAAPVASEQTAAGLVAALLAEICDGSPLEPRCPATGAGSRHPRTDAPRRLSPRRAAAGLHRTRRQPPRPLANRCAA